MKKIFFLIIAGIFSHFLSGQEISNISVTQRQDGSGKVDIYYTLSGSEASYGIAVEVKINNQANWEYVNNIIGDYYNVSPGGGKHIVWNAKAEMPCEYSINAKVRLSASESGGGSCPPTLTDIDGNVYTTVEIGDQCWMQENLKVTHYPNGDTIPNIIDNTAWANLDDNNTDDAYCFYNNQPNSDGALYTYAAAIADSWQRDNTDGQGICPDGWHLPTDGEWWELINFLGDATLAGGKMKETGTSHWWSPNTGATNESGFTALPGGFRYCGNGSFYYTGCHGYWWSATEGTSRYVYIQKLIYSSAYVFSTAYDKSYGFSVRCLKDD